jgi:hypothetical protein
MCFSATTLQAAVGPVAICVPAEPSDPNLPHSTYSGAQIRLKGIARGAATEYRWDLGDGGSTSWTAISNPYNLEQLHTYTGVVGQMFIATLYVRDGSGNQDSDTYRTQIYESSDLNNKEHLRVRIAMSIDEGLWWLHKNMVRGTYAGGSPGYGQPYGYWDPSYYPVAAVGTSVDAFQINGHRVNGDYDGNPYVETVQRALNYLLANTYAFNIFNQTYGNPDTNGNGIGLVTNQNGNLYDYRQTYIGGICMVAMASCGAPNRVASVGRTNIIGRTYTDIVQDMVDFFAYGQVDAGSGRGGWRYYANQGSSDMSTAQWPPLGMLTAEINMGSVVPPFVRNELIRFLNYTQHTGCDTNNGGFGYSYNINYPNCTKAAAGIICHQFLGTPMDDPKIQSAIGFLYRHWNDSGTSWNYTKLHGNSYGMYGVMKAMRLFEDLEIYDVDEPLPITEYDCTTGNQTANSFDWYYTPAGQTNVGLATYIVNTQQSNGSWDDTIGSNKVYDAFCTGWRILIAYPGVICKKPTAVICDCDEQEYNNNQDINLDGSCSYHIDPNRSIVSYEWDFDNDGIVDATGPSATIIGGYSQTGIYPVALRVTDENPDCGPQTNTTICLIDVHPPPHCPHAFAHPEPEGTYDGWVNVPLALDASKSWDPDNEIVSYDWDLDNDGLYGDEDNDCFGEPSDAVGINPQWTWDQPYEGVIGLRVIDAEDQSYDPPTCTDYDFSSVLIGNHPPVSDPIGPYLAPKNATITLDGSGSSDPDPGDFIVSYEWDLDNDGNFDDCTEVQCEFTVGSVVGTVYDICLKVTDSFGEYDITCTTIEIVPYVLPPLDIKPGSCPNPLNTNIRGKGRLPMAILGTEDFDVNDIDPGSISIAGVVVPVKTPGIEDVGTPLIDPEECECHEEGPDGYEDLVIHFSRRALILALGLADMERDTLVPITVTGELLDGTPLMATDCVRIIARSD